MFGRITKKSPELNRSILSSRPCLSDKHDENFTRYNLPSYISVSLPPVHGLSRNSLLFANRATNGVLRTYEDTFNPGGSGQSFRRDPTTGRKINSPRPSARRRLSDDNLMFFWERLFDGVVNLIATLLFKACEPICFCITSQKIDVLLLMRFIGTSTI